MSVPVIAAAIISAASSFAQNKSNQNKSASAARMLDKTQRRLDGVEIEKTMDTNRDPYSSEIYNELYAGGGTVGGSSYDDIMQGWSFGSMLGQLGSSFLNDPTKNPEYIAKQNAMKQGAMNRYLSGLTNKDQYGLGDLIPTSENTFAIGGGKHGSGFDVDIDRSNGSKFSVENGEVIQPTNQGLRVFSDRLPYSKTETFGDAAKSISAHKGSLEKDFSKTVSPIDKNTKTRLIDIDDMKLNDIFSKQETLKAAMGITNKTAQQFGVGGVGTEADDFLADFNTNLTGYKTHSNKIPFAHKYNDTGLVPSLAKLNQSLTEGIDYFLTNLNTDVLSSYNDVINSMPKSYVGRGRNFIPAIKRLDSKVTAVNPVNPIQESINKIVDANYKSSVNKGNGSWFGKDPILDTNKAVTGLTLLDNLYNAGLINKMKEEGNVDLHYISPQQLDYKYDTRLGAHTINKSVRDYENFVEDNLVSSGQRVANVADYKLRALDKMNELNDTANKFNADMNVKNKMNKQSVDMANAQIANQEAMFDYQIESDIFGKKSANFSNAINDVLKGAERHMQVKSEREKYDILSKAYKDSGVAVNSLSYMANKSDDDSFAAAVLATGRSLDSQEVQEAIEAKKKANPNTKISTEYLADLKKRLKK